MLILFLFIGFDFTNPFFWIGIAIDLSFLLFFQSLLLRTAIWICNTQSRGPESASYFPIISIKTGMIILLIHQLPGSVFTLIDGHLRKTILHPRISHALLPQYELSINSLLELSIAISTFCLFLYYLFNLKFLRTLLIVIYYYILRQVTFFLVPWLLGITL